MSASTFRQTVAAVAARAKAILPAAVNGRVESAVALVLAHDVLVLDNGTVEVGSASDPLKVHVLTGATCDCADFPRAPASWCKHRLAHAIYTRVHQEMAARSTPEETETEVLLPEEMEVFPDNDSEGDPEPQPSAPAPAPAPLPEARSSVNVHVTIAGRDCQLTLRDHDEHSLLARLEAILARYPLQATPPACVEPEPEQRYCPTHGTAMRWNAGKDGRKGWHSHRTAEGQWCQGK